MAVSHLPLKQLLQPCADAGELAEVLLRLEKSAARLGLPPPPEFGATPAARRAALTRLVQALQGEYNARQDEFIARGYGPRIGPSQTDVLARALPVWYAEAAWALQQNPAPRWQFWKR